VFCLRSIDHDDVCLIAGVDSWHTAVSPDARLRISAEDSTSSVRERRLRFPSKLPRRRALIVGLVVLGFGFLAFGVSGMTEYIATFVGYRGYPVPHQASTIIAGSGSSSRTVPVPFGTVQTLEVAGPALGGRRDSVIVFLPPGYYVSEHRRYPVLYLLHGFPGSPSQFIDVADLAVVSDTLIAAGRMQPMICVMPSGQIGSSLDSLLVDNEWVNSARAGNAWATFVARDLVNEIDARYRTVESMRGRAIGGLSEGGYGALNLGLHHVGEFGMIEAWSPYYIADDSFGLFEGKRALLAYNSPALELPLVARELRRTRSYVWIYEGSDVNHAATDAFANDLVRLQIVHRVEFYPGGHTWQLWRSQMPNALVAASDYFQHGAPAS
jgi:enterochelin esterase-like enzyme